MKRILIAIGLITLLGLGIFLGIKFNGNQWFQTRTTEKSNVLLKEVKDVMKLVTVEGYFSEVYDYKDYYFADWKAFSKKALIRVKAKVSIGYDLESVTFKVSEASKTLHITGLPSPEILSIDHDLDYYDLQQGSFNTFTVEDYNQLNSKAKAFIEVQVADSELFDRAERQIVDVKQIIKHMAEAQGFQVVFEDEVLVD